MTFAELMVAIVVAGCAIGVALPGRWLLLAVALAVAPPVHALASGQSTQDDSPQSLAIAAVVIFSAPLLLGVCVGAGLKAALRSHRRRQPRGRS